MGQAGWLVLRLRINIIRQITRPFQLGSIFEPPKSRLQDRVNSRLSHSWGPRGQFYAIGPFQNSKLGGGQGTSGTLGTKLGSDLARTGKRADSRFHFT